MVTRPHDLPRIAFIGFGEAGGLLGAALAARGASVATYDLLVEDRATAPALRAKAAAARVRAADTLADALDGAAFVFSAVTASSAHDAAVAAARCLHAGQTYLDLNSVSPDTKRADRDAIAPSGASYVEAAVMAPVPPYGLAVPMLLGGAEAAAVAERLVALGMKARAVATEVGVASAIKMCRSVMIKGLEALTVECLTAARRCGAESEVLASLHETFPQMGWNDALPDYLISRVAEHGRRRAAEMREVAATLETLGVAPRMASATAQAQDALVDAMAAQGLPYAGEGFAWRALADALAAPAATRERAAR